MGLFLLHLFLLVLVALPRFNRNPWVVQAPPRDDVQYVKYVQYFRGEVPGEELRPASSWRPLVPAVASILPGSPMTALSLANLLFLALGLVFLQAVLVRLGAGPRGVAAGGVAYALSFPVFYYATIGYVDPGLIGLLGLGVYLLVRGSVLWLLPLLILATLAKEGSLVLVFAAVAALLLAPEAAAHRVRSALLALLFPLVWIGTMLLVRAYAPGAESDAFWTPRGTILVNNALRPRVWLSALFTFGVPGFLLLYRWRTVLEAVRERSGALLPLLVGSAAAVASWVYAFATAAVDGRSLWTLYPFALPLLLAAWQTHPSPAGSAAKAEAEPSDRDVKSGASS